MLKSAARNHQMRTCDFTGGAWFKTINLDEQHAFFDSDSEQLHTTDTELVDNFLVQITNSKKGYYLCTFVDLTLLHSTYSYCDGTFLAINIDRSYSGGVYVGQKQMRLDIATQDNRVFYI